MNRFLLFLLMLPLIGACSSDDDLKVMVSQEPENSYFIGVAEAMQNAEDFFELLDTTPATRTPRIVKNVQLYNTGNALTRSSNTHPDFYVINYENEGGFALISADSRKFPVYGFATEGHLNLADTIHNPGLRHYLRISSTPVQDNSTIYNRDSMQTSFDKLYIMVKPLLAAKVRDWDQISLNKYVSPHNGDTVPVGCVALATAQIMSYYQLPARWPVKGYDTAKEKYTFNWPEMVNHRVHDHTCRLLEILGRKQYLNMTYNKTGSSSFSSRIPHTFKEFGYVDTVKDKPFDQYDAGMVLSHNQPFIATGNATGERFGHAWVIDGYALYVSTKHLQTPNEPSIKYCSFFHFVWGNWGGSNGYFYYDETNNEFESQARFFNDDENGHGNINKPWYNIHMIYNFFDINE